MNIVKQFMDQLSGDALEKLGSLLGTNPETAERAAGAAVPSLLSALSGMASNDVSARKLANVLGSLDTSQLGNAAQALGGDTSSLLNKGSNLLGSLFGDSMISSLAGALSRFTRLNTGSVKTLLAYLAPLVLGKVAAQWKNQGGTPEALQSLFATQRENISDAMPPGLWLADVPGIGDVRNAASGARRKAEEAYSSAGSTASWLIPAAIVLLGGLLLWQFFSRRGAEQAVADAANERADQVTAMKPVIPQGIDAPGLASVREEVGGLFNSLDSTLTEIRDAESAQRAMPALRDINTKIDTMTETLSRLPAAARTSLRPVIEEQSKLVVEKANAVSSIQGITAELKALLQEIVAKIRKWISADVG